MVDLVVSVSIINVKNHGLWIIIWWRNHFGNTELTILCLGKK